LAGCGFCFGGGLDDELEVGGGVDALDPPLCCVPPCATRPPPLDDVPDRLLVVGATRCPAGAWRGAA
jgi:hypothetical protein